MIKKSKKRDLLSFSTCTDLIIALLILTTARVEGVLGQEKSDHWPEAVRLVSITSTADGQLQKAYHYSTQADEKKPLVVSLHSWSGDFTQKDPLAFQCLELDVNYVHPDFRGPNTSEEACCSHWALSDIDDAIDFAMRHGRVDTAQIMVVGGSGGGYATLCAYMKSRHSINNFSAWVPIVDLEAWFHQSKIRNNKYAQNILDCTGSGVALNVMAAQERSPISMNIPDARSNSKLSIYAGVNDGISGSVPITHSINMYNKIIYDIGATQEDAFVTDQEKLFLLEYRRPISKLGLIDGRRICLEKKYKNVQLIIFEGGHEMLSNYVLESMGIH